MKRIFRERERLLRRAARLIGLTGAAVAALTLLVPNGSGQESLFWAFAGLALYTVALTGVSINGSLVWAGVAAVAGLGGIYAVGTATMDDAWISLFTIMAIAAVALPGLSLVLLGSLRARILLALIVAGGIALPLYLGASSEYLLVALVMIIASWIATITVTWFLRNGVDRAMQRIDEIGLAHRTERLASELESQQRQDARLLHDTVLATLSLLAHSGHGVHAEALRQQAADDAHLLRQLRLGHDASSTGTQILHPAVGVAPQLSTTFDSLRQRFERMGLRVNWHGSGQLYLPSYSLDAFLGALIECLENVRRHSGTNSADVTVSDDETTVRAVVTDAGVGFDATVMDSARLGFAESVVGRLESVGGRARLFSSPGAGTTVVLEVPK